MTLDYDAACPFKSSRLIVSRRAVFPEAQMRVKDWETKMRRRMGAFFSARVRDCGAMSRKRASLRPF